MRLKGKFLSLLCSFKSWWCVWLGVLIIPTGAEHSGPRIYFEDVTEKSGLKLERVFSPDKKYIIEGTGGGVAFLDYDNDGWLDVYLINTPTVESFKSNRVFPNRLYRNNRDSTFTEVSERAGVAFRGWGMGVCVADYDKDGDSDVYLTNYGPNALYRNNGDGTFSEVTSKAGVGDPRYSSSCGWADYDGDGDLDLFVANYVELDLNHLPEFGKGKYCLYKMLEVHCAPGALKGASDTLYRNNGDGTFTDVSKEAGVSDERGYYGLGVAWADLNDDGYPDLYVANDTNPNYVYLNQGNGTFRELGLLSGASLDSNGNARAGMGIAIGDYDNDGQLDVGVTNLSSEAYALFRNKGSGGFEDVAFQTGIGKVTLPYVGWGTFFADFDNDGWKDWFGANGHVYPQVDQIDVGTKYRQSCLVFRNLRNGAFTDVTAESGRDVNTPRSHRGAGLGDYDNDGDLDILVMDLDGGPVLLENRSVPQGNYLRVKAPVGSRVTLEAGGLKQMDEIRASGSYQSACEQVAHFGIGNAPVVDRLVVRFPNGRTKTLDKVKANELLTIDLKSGY
ncbi:MAG: CRTAC1 family protein [Acidobacteria bacterium]|nr:CRTAC1 family protein [Acidobacteriota bacterium]